MAKDRVVNEEGVHPVVNTGEGSGASVPLPPAPGPAEGDKYPGGVVPETRPSTGLHDDSWR